VRALHVSDVPVFERRTNPIAHVAERAEQIGSPADSFPRLQGCHEQVGCRQTAADTLADPVDCIVEPPRNLSQVQHSFRYGCARQLIGCGTYSVTRHRPVNHHSADRLDTEAGRDSHVDQPSALLGDPVQFGRSVVTQC
jgi:hypothetical protein